MNRLLTAIGMMILTIVWIICMVVFDVKWYDGEKPGGDKYGGRGND